jgi:hypothetical protein
LRQNAQERNMNKSKAKALILERRPWKVQVADPFRSAKEDLDWFFHRGESECGVQSNFNALIRALKFSTTHQEESAEDQLISMIDGRSREKDLQSIMDGTRKYRKILARYQKLSIKSQFILQNFYYEKQYDISVELFFGAGINLIPHTATFQKIKNKVDNLDQLKNLIIHDRRRMQKIKKEIAEMFLTALAEYSGEICNN